MAKRKPADTVETAVAPETKKPGKPTKVTVEARRSCPFGEVGDVLGEVTLAPGVSLNYFVDAVRNGFAGEQHSS